MNQTAINPYVAGAPLRGELDFYGRQDSVNWAVQALGNSRTNALILFGQRRIGKTTLLLHIKRILPDDAFLPVYFDLQDQTTRSLGHVLADLADVTAEEAGMEPPEWDAFDDDGRFFRRTFLPQLYEALDKQRRPVFLFDEFDVLDQVAEAKLAPSAAAKAFVPFVRRLMTDDPRPAFVFVIGRRAEDISLDLTATFKTSSKKELWVLERENAEALIRQAEKNGTLHFTDDAVARILFLTNHHPYLAQLLCQRIWERAYVESPVEPPLIEMAEVETAVTDALESGEQALIWLWNGLTPAEKIYAAALAEIADEGEIISEDRIIETIITHAARLRAREVTLAPHDLVERHILERVGEWEYSFAIELFRRWVWKYKPLSSVKEEIDKIDPQASRLFIAGQGFFSREQWPDAIRYFQDTLKEDPDHFQAQLNLGKSWLALDEIDKAVTELERAYELDPIQTRYPLVNALTALANLRYEADQKAEALIACRRVLEISPHEKVATSLSATICTEVGNLAFEQNELDEALFAYKEAGNVEKVRQVKETQVKAYERMGKWDEAAVIYGELISELPDHEKRTTWQEAQKQAQEEGYLAYLFVQSQGAIAQANWSQAQQLLAEIIHIRPDYEKNSQNAVGLLQQAVAKKRVSFVQRLQTGKQKISRTLEQRPHERRRGVAGSFVALVLIMLCFNTPVLPLIPSPTATSVITATSVSQVTNETPSPTVTNAPLPTRTLAPIVKPTTPSSTITPSSTNTSTSTYTPTATYTLTSTATSTLTPTATKTATLTPTGAPTKQPTSELTPTKNIPP